MDICCIQDFIILVILVILSTLYKNIGPEGGGQRKVIYLSRLACIFFLALLPLSDILIYKFLKMAFKKLKNVP